MSTAVTYDDFAKLDIRVGVIEEVLDFPEARKPTYKLHINFGPEIGKRWSSAQVTQHYTKEQQIGPFISELLTLGVPDRAHNCILIVPSKTDAKIGGKLY